MMTECKRKPVWRACAEPFHEFRCGIIGINKWYEMGSPRSM